MLTAKNSSGKIINLGMGHCISDLKKYREKEQFYCPQCSSKLILKLGMKKIPHFAHEKLSSCAEEYDRESQYHLLSKLHLYKWLVNQQVSAQLELFLPEMNRRPDILFTFSGKKYCIEFQSSKIPEEIFVERTKQYIENSIEPIWIMAGKNIKRLGEHKVSLSSFDYLFSRQASSYSYLLAYCPVTLKLISLKNLVPISIRHSVVQFSITPLEKAKVEHLITPRKIENPLSLKLWFQEINKLKTNMLIRPNPDQRKFLLELYENNLYLQYLPPIIGLPLSENIRIETPALIWHTYLFIDLFMKKKVGKTISYQQVYLCFLNRLRKQEIKIRSLPLQENWQPSHIIGEYLAQLVHLEWLEKLANNEYLIKRPLILSANQQEHEKMESLCINKGLLKK